MRNGIRLVLNRVPELKPGLRKVALAKLAETLLSASPFGMVILMLHVLVTGMASATFITSCSVALAVLAILYWVTIFVGMRLSWPMGTQLATRLRIRLGEHLRTLPMGWFQGKSTASSLKSLVSDEIQMIQMIPSHILPMLIPVMVGPALLLVVLPFLDWRMALVTASVIPPAFWFFFRNQQAHKQGFAARSTSLERLTAETVEYIQGMETLKAFRHVGSGFRRLHQAMHRFHDDSVQAIIPGIASGFAYFTCLDLCAPLVLAGATYFYLNGTLSLALFIGFLVLGPRMTDPLRLLIGAFGMYRLAEPALESAEAIFAHKPLPTPASPVVPKGQEIRFNNVSFTYHDSKVLDDVSFSVPESKITALVGPSGAGKTTVTNLIARFWDVDSGSITMGGVNIKDMPQDAVLGRLSMVFQDVFLFNDTIYNNIAFGRPGASKTDIMNAARMACCHDFITALPHGYETQLGEQGGRLSGGERQRISIARAILKDAPIILLDEATASVDPENEKLLQAALAGLVQSKTLLVIAHRLSTIATADQIIVLDGKGGIAETGDHQSLLSTNGLYKKFWESRKQAEQWGFNKTRKTPMTP